MKVGIWKKIEEQAIPQDLVVHRNKLKEYVLKSKSDNTLKSYKTYFNTFCKWCKKYDFKPLPACSFHVGLYLSFVAKTDPSESKVNAIINGISAAHKLAGLTDPCSDEFIKNVKTGILRVTGKPVKQKEAISSNDIEKLVVHFDSETNLLHKRFITMSLLSFAGFLRFDELVRIRRSDVEIDSVQVKLFIHSSKTDQTKKGCSVVIARTHKETCPVKALEKYIEMSKIQEDSDEFLFRKVVYCKKKGTYALRPGPAITYTRAREILLKNLSEIGLESKKFGLHSFRAGGTTAAIAMGTDDRLVQKHGRWKSETTKNLYVRENETMKRSVTLNLGI